MLHDTAPSQLYCAARHWTKPPKSEKQTPTAQCYNGIMLQYFNAMQQCYNGIML